MKYLLFLHFPLYTVSIACYYNSKHMFCLEVNGMEEHHTQIGELSVANIPIQMLAITDRNGKLTPLWFRFETKEHRIEKIAIEKTISRDESHCAGIREKKFICSAIFGVERRLMEIRYHIESQKWRIFRFLS